MELQNLHQIVQETAVSNEKEPAMVPKTYKIQESDYDAAVKILEVNGSSPSKFIRQCFKRLVAEYK